MSEVAWGLTIAGIASVAAIVYGLILVRQVLALPAGNERMQDIAQAIQEGAEAYLRRQYQIVAIVAVFVAVLLAIVIDWETAVDDEARRDRHADVGHLGEICALAT